RPHPHRGPHLGGPPARRAARLHGEQHRADADAGRAARVGRAGGGWYIAHVHSLSPGQLEEAISFRFTDGDAGRMSREEILAHVIHHSSHHRGNVGMLMKLADKPPPRDLFTRHLHHTEPQRREAA
ncbi:MAG: hypothetical protein EOP35_16735, partial [Rubrivivax sp.]